MIFYLKHGRENGDTFLITKEEYDEINYKLLTSNFFQYASLTLDKESLKALIYEAIYSSENYTSIYCPSKDLHESFIKNYLWKFAHDNEYKLQVQIKSDEVYELLELEGFE